MRENLIFSGLAEATDTRNENCERKVKEFIRTELHIEKDIQFDRVHRLGRYSASQRYHRPIVAKFTFYRDKELVRQEAPKWLMGSRFRVKEHFPPEIEEKRKLLYDDAKAARQNTNNRVKLVRDKLYVNGQQFIPGWSNLQDAQFNAEGSQATHQEGSFGNQRSRPRTEHRYQQSGATGIHLNRYPRNAAGRQRRGADRGAMRGTGFGHGTERGQFGAGRKNFPPAAETPTSNRFDGLRNEASAWSVNEENDNNWERQSQYSGKRKPTSPVDTDISSKRQTDHMGNGNKDNVNMDYEQSRAETVGGNGDSQDTRL